LKTLFQDQEERAAGDRANGSQLALTLPTRTGEGRRTLRNLQVSGDTMGLRFIGKDPGTDGANCPTAWVDDTNCDILMQGSKADEATLAMCREAGPIPDNETVIRLPVRMVAVIREACDAAERSAL
jgi:hypothetical protein